MVNPILVLREERVRAHLAQHGELRTRQLIARGASWRTVMNLAADGEIEYAGSDERARVRWRLTPARS